MGKPVVITATEQTVAVTKPGKVFSISFASDDEDLHVKLLDGGAYGTGTEVWKMLIDATTALGDERFEQSFGEDGIDFNAGINVNITKDGAAAAGTGNINLNYKDLSVG